MPVSKFSMLAGPSPFLGAGRTVSMTGPNCPLAPVNAVRLMSFAQDCGSDLTWRQTEAATATATVLRTIVATKYFFVFIIFPFQSIKRRFGEERIKAAKNSNFNIQAPAVARALWRGKARKAPGSKLQIGIGR